MKKIFILAAGLLMTGAAYAQSPVRFGVKAGVNVANIIKDDGNNNFSTDAKTGFNAGLTADIPLAAGIAFTPEVLFAQKGYKLTNSFGEYSQTTNFIDIPILASIRLASPLNLVVGPQVSFLMSTKNKFETGYGSVEDVNENSDQFKKSLLGGVIGARYDLTQNVDVHARYALDFQKNNENGTTNTPEFKNQVWSFGLGYKF